MRPELYENKITLKKIKIILCPEMSNKDFLNKIFKPLSSGDMPFLKLYSMEHKTTVLMNGNYRNGSRENYTKLKEEWKEKLCAGRAAEEMTGIIEAIIKDIDLSENYGFFELLKSDDEAMPDDLKKFIAVCLDENLKKAIFILVLWAVYGECITFVSEIYSNDKNTVNRHSNKVKLISRIKPCRPVFIGRDNYIDMINDHFSSGENFIFLKGMGGIGKSECAKQYARKYRENYDTIVFAECTDSIEKLISSNSIFTLTEPFFSEHMPDESESEFYERKFTQLKMLDNKNVLVIIDNLDRFDAETENIITLPFNFIITSRWDYFKLYPEQTICVEKIDDKFVLNKIFSEYYGKDLSDDMHAYKLIDMFEGHTMAIELIAKQMKTSSLTASEMFDILSKNKENELEEDFPMLNYGSESRNFSMHIQTLFNVASLNDEEKYILMCLSLMPLSGIDKKDFKQACGLNNYNSVNKAQ